MGLFGFGKKKQAEALAARETAGMEKEQGLATGQADTAAGDAFWGSADFVFEIQKVMPYKEQGSVLIGRAQSGQLLPDTKVSYVDKNGRTVFNCTVGGMEQNGFKVKRASACQFGLYGPMFTLVIPDFAPNAFGEGNFLYLKAEAGAELSPLLEAFENCRLSREREQEIRLAVEEKVLAGDGDVLTEQMKQVFDGYSVQEMIFALTYVRDAGNHAKQADGEGAGAPIQAKAEQLYPMMLEKLRGLERVYLTIDKNTNFPFLNNGFVDVYTKEEYAQLAVLFYKEQFRELEVRPMPVTKSELLPPQEGRPLAAQMPAFVLLYYLGMERVLLDDGLYRAALSRGDVLPPPDHSGMPAQAVPVTNPALRIRILDFFGEARWKVNYEKRGEVLQAKEHAMLAEVAKGKFLVPMKYEGAAQPKPGANQIVFDKNTKLMFAAIKNTAGENYTPVFTDFIELGKMYAPKEWGAAAITIRDAVSINKGDGVVVNPAGENLVLKEKALAAVMEMVQQMKQEKDKAAAKGEPDAADGSLKDGTAAEGGPSTADDAAGQPGDDTVTRKA